MSNTVKNIIHILCVFAGAVLFQVFFLLSLFFFKSDWAKWLYLLVLIGGTVLNLAVFAIEISFYFLKKELIYKTCITAYVLAVFIAIVAYILLKTGFLEIMRDEKAFEEYLKRSGSWMSILSITLQFLQVVLPPIPSFVTVAAGTALFGPALNVLYSLIGILLGSTVAFIVGRYAGYRAVAWLVGKETLDKWLRKVKGKDKLLLSAMFLLPVFPDDVLCFVAGLSSMSFVFFLVVILISRVLAIVTTSYSISLIPFNTWWGLMIWGAFFLFIIILFVFLYKKSEAIQAWFEKKLHRETRVEKKAEKDEFTLQIVDPDGAIVEKGVKKGAKKEEPSFERNADRRDHE